MKHLLNNLSEEEKNSIREQHTGGLKVMTENFSKLLNSKLGDSKPLVNEQKNGNPFKEKIADLIDEITSLMSGYRSADDLILIYKKLLPLKGKKVGDGEIRRYKEMDADDQDPNLLALHYFNNMYSQMQNNQYGMGGPYDFTQQIEKVGEKTPTGDIEKTKDGKYTTQQVKKMIINLVNNG